MESLIFVIASATAQSAEATAQSTSGTAATIPFWEDWRFWQIVVTGALALAGFTLGTWIKYLFDRRLDQERRERDANELWSALRAETFALRHLLARRALQAGDILSSAQDYKVSKPEMFKRAYFEAMMIPAAPIYHGNVGRLGLIGNKGATLLAEFHGTVRDMNDFISLRCARNEIDAKSYRTIANHLKAAKGVADEIASSPEVPRP